MLKGRFSVPLIVLGLSGMIAQIVLLRELLVTYYGNELTIGIILANWLVLEAAGRVRFGFRTNPKRRFVADRRVTD